MTPSRRSIAWPRLRSAEFDAIRDAAMSGGDMLDGGENSVRTRVFGVVNALMRRRQLPAPVAADQNLREAGLKSLDLVNMMLAIEDEFGIEIPQERLTMDHFRTVAAIERLVADLAR